MNPEKINSIIGIILSLVPFLLIGGWLAYRQTKSRPPKAGIAKKTAARILVHEKATGKDAIVTACGFEDGAAQPQEAMEKLPKLIRVRYRMENGIFSAEDSDWLPGEDFDIVSVIQVVEG